MAKKVRNSNWYLTIRGTLTSTCKRSFLVESLQNFKSIAVKTEDDKKGIVRETKRPIKSNSSNTVVGKNETKPEMITGPLVNMALYYQIDFSHSQLVFVCLIGLQD